MNGQRSKTAENEGLKQRDRRLTRTHQVHPIPRTRNQTSIRQRVHRRQLLERHRAVHVVDRHELDSPEATVDFTDKFVHYSAEVLVFFDILTRGNGELDKNDLQLAR